MDWLSKEIFNAALQARLAETQKEMNLSHPQMANALGVKTDAYKKYAKRGGSGFPIYLLPRLVFVTNKPLSYWLAGQPAPPRRLRVVTSA